MVFRKPRSGALIVSITVNQEIFNLFHIIEEGNMYAPTVPPTLGNMSLMSLMSLLQGSVSLYFWTDGSLGACGSLNFGDLGQLSFSQKLALLRILWMGFCSPTGLVRK